jgi:hypothetical protein
MTEKYFESAESSAFESEGDAFRNGIDQEWGQYVAGYMERTSEDMRLHPRVYPDPKAYLEGKKQEFDSFNFERRIARMVNNFHFWWPGGYFRELKIDNLENTEDKSDSDVEKLAFNKKLCADLDEILREEGYTNERIGLVLANDGTNSAERLRALGNVFLKMRARGYDGTLLRG